MFDNEEMDYEAWVSYMEYQQEVRRDEAMLARHNATADSIAEALREIGQMEEVKSVIRIGGE